MGPWLATAICGNDITSSCLYVSGLVIAQAKGLAPLLTGSPLVVISGANAADFIVTLPPAASVAPGASTTFAVTFDPSLDGDRIADIHIANNDTDRNTYDFVIKGRGVAPPKAPKNVRPR